MLAAQSPTVSAPPWKSDNKTASLFPKINHVFQQLGSSVAGGHQLSGRDRGCVGLSHSVKLLDVSSGRSKPAGIAETPPQDVDCAALWTRKHIIKPNKCSSVIVHQNTRFPVHVCQVRAERWIALGPSQSKIKDERMVELDAAQSKWKPTWNPSRCCNWRASHRVNDKPYFAGLKCFGAISGRLKKNKTKPNLLFFAVFIKVLEAQCWVSLHRSALGHFLAVKQW